MIRKIAVITVVVLLVSSSIALMGYLYQKNQKPPEVVVTEKPQYSTLIKKSVATGTIEPRKEVMVRPQISGIIEQLFVKPGDYVKKGAQIAQIRIIPNMIRMNDAETSLRTATINFELAEAEFKRQEGLFNDKVISQSEFIKFAQDYRIKKEQLESAKSNLEIVKNGTSQRIANTSTLVRATIDGKILDIPIRVGSNVIEANTFNEGTTVASIANMNDLIFKGKVVESEVGKLQIGMPLMLTIGAIPDQILEATLEFIASKGIDDKGTIQFEVKAGLKDVSNLTIRAGYSASAEVIVQKKEHVLTISERNIEFKGDTCFVYVETSPQNFVKKAIKTGLTDDFKIEVLSGLDTTSKIKVLGL